MPGASLGRCDVERSQPLKLAPLEAEATIDPARFVRETVGCHAHHSTLNGAHGAPYSCDVERSQPLKLAPLVAEATIDPARFIRETVGCAMRTIPR
jgi:hypothetical protein